MKRWQYFSIRERVVVMPMIIIIIIIKNGLQEPRPTIPTYREKEEKWKNSRRQKLMEQLRPIKSIDPALETRKSHTIEYRVSKIVPQGH